MTHAITPVAPKLRWIFSQYMLPYEDNALHLQVASPHTPHLEHERDSVVKGNAQNERAHQSNGCRPRAESLRGDLSDVGIRNASTSNDAKVGYAGPKYLMKVVS